MRRIDRASTSVLVIVGLGTVIRIPQVGHSLAGDHAFRQTQTAFAIREFATHGVSLLHGPLPIFGSATDVPLEFPLFQAAATPLVHLGLGEAAAGRLAGLLSFQAALVLWWVLLRRWRGATLATTTLVLAEVLPFGLHWGAACLIDFFSLVWGFTMVLGYDVWLRAADRRRWLGLAGCVVGAWGVFLVKVTTVPAVGILLVISAALAVHDLRLGNVWKRVVAGLLAGPATALVPLVVWTRHADRIKDQAAATRFLDSGNVRAWNFGGDRLSSVAWQTLGDRAAGDLGGLALAVLVVGVALGLVVAGRATRILTCGLVTATLAPVLIFFNLYVRHSYYVIGVYPMVVALCALGAVVIWEAAPRRSLVFAVPPVLLVISLLAMTYASPLGRHDLADFARGSNPPALARDLGAISGPHDRVIAVGCDWDPQYLYFAHRTGLMLRTTDPAELDAIWRENDIRDFAFVVRCTSDTVLGDYLPPNTVWSATAKPNVYALQRPPT